MNIEKVISDTLQGMGMLPDVQGYRYIKDSISLCLANIDYLDNITKGLYPYIAEKWDSTASKVERSIRHAKDRLLVINKEDRTDLFNEIFRFWSDNTIIHLTNSKFLAIVVEYIYIKKQVEEENEKQDYRNM